MLSLRQKLLLGFGGLLLIILIGGIQSIIQFRHLGQSIDVILKENYRSVVACQDMKEALERMDSGVLFNFLGYQQLGNEQINMNEANDRARKDAASAQERMYLFLLCGILVAFAFMLFIGKWILRPIERLIRSTEEIRDGNLDLVVQIDSR